MNNYILNLRIDELLLYCGVTSEKITFDKLEYFFDRETDYLKGSGEYIPLTWAEFEIRFSGYRQQFFCNTHFSYVWELIQKYYKYRLDKNKNFIFSNRNKRIHITTRDIDKIQIYLEVYDTLDYEVAYMKAMELYDAYYRFLFDAEILKLGQGQDAYRLSKLLEFFDVFESRIKPRYELLRDNYKANRPDIIDIVRLLENLVNKIEMYEWIEDIGEYRYEYNLSLKRYLYKALDLKPFIQYQDERVNPILDKIDDFAVKFMKNNHSSFMELDIDFSNLTTGDECYMACDSFHKFINVEKNKLQVNAEPYFRLMNEVEEQQAESNQMEQ